MDSARRAIFQLMGQFGLAARRFGRHRRGGAAVEFALVGLT